jgi:hypothetical protein
MAPLPTRATMAMHFPLLNRRLGVVLGALIGLPASASAAPMHCPGQITVEQRAIQLPADLQAFDSEARHVWVNAQFSDGPPSEQAWLAPDSTHENGKSVTNIWRFTASASGTWLACGYTGTSLVAAFRLPDSVRSCEVRYDKTFSPPAATAVDCH